MTPDPGILSALLLGLLGSTHCIGMCGGISGALAFALGPDLRPARRYMLLTGYSLGRIMSYAVMGALFAGAAGGLAGDGGMRVLRIVAGAAGADGLLSRRLAERAGAAGARVTAWRHVQGLAARLIRWTGCTRHCWREWPGLAALRPRLQRAGRAGTSGSTARVRC
jgi:hypothetical protein